MWGIPKYPYPVEKILFEQNTKGKKIYEKEENGKWDWVEIPFAEIHDHQDSVDNLHFDFNKLLIRDVVCTYTREESKREMCESQGL